MLYGFSIMSLVSMLVISITSLIAYETLRFVWVFMPRMHAAPRLRVFLTLIPIFGVHIVSIWIYAGVFLLVENFTDFGHLTGNIEPAELSYASFVERLYYSATAYTSLGFGDIVPASHLRMLSSAEVLNGLVLIGWTISFTYLAMEKFWRLPYRHKRHALK